MPTISTFFGILVRMYYKEHGIQHFHAEYQGLQATFKFDGAPLAGDLGSRTATRLVGNGRRLILKSWKRTGRERDGERP